MAVSAALLRRSVGTQRLSARRCVALCAVLLLTASLFSASAQALSISGFKNSLITFLLEKISVPGEFEVLADEVQSPSNGSSILKGVRISDARGVWFKAAQLSLAFSPSKLLLGQVQIDSISIEGADLQRLPQVDAQQGKPIQNTSALVWPRSPIAVNIAKIAITSMHVSAQILAQAMTFDATGTLRDEGDEQSLTLAVKRVDKVAGRIDVSYIKRFDDDRLTLDLQASEAAGGLVAKAASLPGDLAAMLKLVGDGTPSQWNAQLKLTVDSLLDVQGTLAANWLQRIGVDLAGTVIPGPRLAQSARLAIGKQARFELRAQENEHGLVHIQRAQLDAQALKVSGQGHFDRPRALLDLVLEARVDRDGAQRLSALTQPLTFEQASFQITAKGPLDAPTLAGRGELRTPKAAGFAAASADVVFDVPSADGSTATLQMVAASPTGPSPAYATAFGPRITIKLVTSRHGETIAIDTARLQSDALQANASGRITMAAAKEVQATPLLDLTYTMTVADITPLAALADVVASGALAASGSARGALNELTTKGDIRLHRARVNGQDLGRVDIAHNTQINEHISGYARLKMSSADFGPGSAAARFRVQAQSVALERLTLDLLGIQAKGQLRLPAGARMPIGELDFTLTSLEPIARLSGQQLSGHGRGHAQFAARGGGESRVQAEFNALHINEFSVQRLQVNGTASDLASDRDGATPRLALHIDAAAVTAADNTRLQHVSLHADGPLGALSVNAKLAGSHRERALAATLRAIATLDQPRKTVRVNALQANYGDEVLQLLQPTLITTSARSVHIDNLDLSIADQGRLRGWFKQEPAAASMNLELASIPLHLLKVFAALPIAKGRLSGTVSGSTDRAAPALDARLSVSQLRMDNAPAATGALAAALTAAWDGHALSADLSISGPFEPAITGRFRVPMTLAKPSPAPSKGKGKGKGEDTGSSSTSTSSLPVLNLDSTIDAQLDWRGQVEPVMALLPLPDHVLTGVATIALRVAGTLNAPLPSGELTLRNGRYENLQAGTIIEDLTLNSDFSDQQRVQFSLTGHDAEQGKLRAQGVILPGQPEQLLDITAQLEHMLLVRVDAATILSSADLSIKSSAQALNVNGKVVIEQAEIRLLNPLPPSIVDLGEVHIAGQASAADLANRGEAVVPVRLDIGIEIPGQTFVRGRGLDSEWGGSMRISGSAAQPSVEGHIESIRGVLDLVGRTFDLRRGRIVFAGKGAIDPNLDLRLVREANGITGTVFVEGTGSKPSLRFSSNPALPADEVLPRLLFGRSKQSLSGPEAVQLAAGLAALARGDESVLDVARKALGVDVLRIESGTDGADSAGNLSVGRYATEKIYVGAKQSLDGKATSVVVEIELPKNFVVDTEVGQNADGSVGITWRRDF